MNDDFAPRFVRLAAQLKFGQMEYSVSASF